MGVLFRALEVRINLILGNVSPSLGPKLKLVAPGSCDISIRSASPSFGPATRCSVARVVPFAVKPLRDTQVKVLSTIPG